MPATIPEVVALLARYAKACGCHAFSRKDFAAWAANHGLSRRTAPETVDNAIAEALTLRLIEPVADMPACYCAMRKAVA